MPSVRPSVCPEASSLSEAAGVGVPSVCVLLWLCVDVHRHQGILGAVELFRIITGSVAIGSRENSELHAETGEFCPM